MTVSNGRHDEPLDFGGIVMGIPKRPKTLFSSSSFTGDGPQVLPAILQSTGDFLLRMNRIE